MLTRAALPACGPEAAVARVELYKSIREYFYYHRVLEVETPILSQGTVVDTHLDPLHLEYHLPGSQAGLRLYLQTSPELHMKRLLAADFPDLFQISRVFRDYEKGSWHNPEFSLCEWYRCGMSLDSLMEEVITIARLAVGPVEAIRYTFAEVFQLQSGIDIFDITDAGLREWIRKRGDASLGIETRADCLLHIMNRWVEPHLTPEKLCIIYDYPIELACLSQPHPNNARLAERFELYFQGLELANGYHELRDPVLQRERFLEENLRRVGLGKNELPLDEAFFGSLTKGFPDCSGVAIGLDRLLALSLRLKGLEKCLHFPFERC